MSNIKNNIFSDENGNLNNPKNPFLMAQRILNKEKNLQENIKNTKDKSNDIENKNKPSKSQDQEGSKSIIMKKRVVIIKREISMTIYIIIHAKIKI